MRRRHKIKEVVVWEGSRGFSLFTNGGHIGFSAEGYTGGSQRTRMRLRYHLPHIHKTLIGAKLEVGELRDLLIGRYVYGRSVISVCAGLTVKHLI